jgi:hypothetical protein
MEQMLDIMLSSASRICTDNGIKLIIFYHPTLNIQKDGTVYERSDNDYLQVFQNICLNNDILFINMGNAFIKEYENNHVLPHGFSNTAVGRGHINKNGHRIIALELFRQINKIESKDII